MMKTWIAALCLLGCFSALARLGENQVQFATRYGNPLESRGQTNRTRTVELNCKQSYSYQGWRLKATFAGGIAEEVVYEKTAPYSDQDMQAVMQAETGGGRWYQVNASRWTNSNGSVFTGGRYCFGLTVKSARAVQRDAAAEAARKQTAPPPKF